MGMSLNAAPQVPQLDDNGDGIYGTKTDGAVARNYTIGSGILLAGDDPMIGGIVPPQTLHGETQATVWVEPVTSTGRIAKVVAVLTPPGWTGGPSAR